MSATFGENQRAEAPVTALEGRGPVSLHSRTNVRPPGQAGPVERGPDKASKTRWAPVELKQRSEVICAHWAAISGRDVRLEDAAKIARLSLPLAAISKVLRTAWQRRTGIALAWPQLRVAELEYLAYEAARRTS
jgi:hypothetical protein